MKKNSPHNRAKLLKILLISMYLIVSFSICGLAQGSDATVTQPDIIPKGVLTTEQKLYLPYNSSGESTKGYVENRLLPGIASSIIGITGGVALVISIISGIMMLVSFGNTDTFGKARKTLIYALGGVVVAGLSYAILKIIASIKIT
jgi:hypothetical protein